MQRKSNIGINLSGIRREKYTVIEKSPKGRTKWVCKCDCGKVFELCASKILSEKQISCGCIMRKARIKFGQSQKTHGDSHTRLYKTYRSMIDRCYNENLKGYQRYGARGIRVCQEWRDSYESFKGWALQNGYVDGLGRALQSIERIDVNGNYCPENCRWATASEQQKNRRNTTIFDYEGKQITASEFADIHGISDKSFVYRKIRQGYSLDDILSEWRKKKNIPVDLIECSLYAQQEGICTASVTRRIREGKIEGERIGRKWYVVKKGDHYGQESDVRPQGHALQGAG